MTAPDSMVERVARAICDAEGEGHEGMARAALRAMREPDPIMLDATGHRNLQRAAEQWRAAINAALAEPNQP